MLFDLRIAVRSLSKSPVFALSAIATLALGIGANTAIFSLVSQVLLNPAGVSRPERVVAVRARYEKLALQSISLSVPDFADIENSSKLFESAALLDQGDFNYTGASIPERLQGAMVSWRFFDVFGARPLLGRVFTQAEDRPDANQEIVLSFAAWKRLFGQDQGVLGRTIDLNQKPYRVVGVMGPEFRWPATIDLWTPLGLPVAAYDPGNRFNENYGAFARLRPGVTFAQASAWVQLLTNRYKQTQGRGAAYAKDSAWGMFVLPFTDFIAGDTKTPLLVLLGAVGFVLLIACSGIAGLMLARATGRAREVAVRSALGASRWDLVRGTLAEAAVLSLAGAAAGLAVAWVAIQTALRFLTPDSPQFSRVAFDVRLDPSVLLYTTGIAVLAGVLFGIAPAWQILRMGRMEPLKEGGRSGTAGMARQRLRSVLVTGEIALALVLLVGAGLFLRSLSQLEDVNPGFNPAGVTAANVSLPVSVYDNADKRESFYRSVLDRLAAAPGVTAAAAGVPVPFSGNGGSASFQIEGRPVPAGDPGPHGDIGMVSPGYFQTLRIPLRAGRLFTDQDRKDTEPVVVIDETLAHQYWPQENPVGRHLRQGSRSPWVTIVGVTGHVKQTDLAGADVKGKYYFPEAQRSAPFTTFLVRTNGDGQGMTAAIRQAVRDVDPNQPVSQIRTLSSMVATSLAARRFVVVLLAFFAGTALLMAALGLYGVIAYAVTQRTQEIGIRMALGARRSDVMGMVIRQGLQLAGAGVLLGLVASVAISRVMRSQLFRTSPFDPLTFVVMAAVLALAALLASYLPARRATRVDPMVALRYE